LFIVRNDEAGGSNPLPSTNLLWHTVNPASRLRGSITGYFLFMKKPLHSRSALRGLSVFSFAALSLLAGCGKLRNSYAQKEPDKPHSVTLNWKASVSRVAGYNIYRASAPGGPIKLTARIVSGTQYVDTTVEAGRTYSYSVTSVDFNGKESVPSRIITVTIPTAATQPAKQ
jgi:hypothetical protein